MFNCVENKSLKHLYYYFFSYFNIGDFESSQAEIHKLGFPYVMICITHFLVFLVNG